MAVSRIADPDGAIVYQINYEWLHPVGEGLTAEIAGRHWTKTETAVHEEPMKLINAPIRAARRGGRAA